MTKPAKHAAAGSRPWALLRDERAAAAVEFAMVAWPFIFLLLWIVQLGMFFMTQASLDSGVIAEAETLRADLVAGTLPTAATLKAGVVSNAGPLVANNSTLSVEIRTLTDLDSSTVAITDGYADYGTTTSTLVLRAKGQAYSFAPGFGSIFTVTSMAMVRRQGK
jgi:Flp pilus assembly protein TadG